MNNPIYTREHAGRQHAIREWQVLIRTGFAGREIISKVVSNMTAHWSVVPAPIYNIRFVHTAGPAAGVIAFTARTNPRIY